MGRANWFGGDAFREISLVSAAGASNGKSVGAAKGGLGEVLAFVYFAGDHEGRAGEEVAREADEA
jgi:hypothetical protein